MIFGISIPKATGHQTATQFPTSPNICFYTTWGKQNKRNMRWNEQQTSTNWRLDRTKIWSRWSELISTSLTYYNTSCYQTCRWWHVVFQQDSAPAHRRAKRSNCWSAKPQILSLRICGPPTALTSIWSITSSGGSCNSGSIRVRRRSRMWMNSRSDWLKSGLVCSRTLLTLLSMHGETVCVLVFPQRADISNIDCSNWTTGHLDKLSWSDRNVNQIWSMRVILVK